MLNMLSTILTLCLLCCFPLVFAQYTYICEHSSVEYKPGIIIVAPGFSYNRGLVPASCQMALLSNPGTKLRLTAFTVFVIGSYSTTCSTDFLQVSTVGSNMTSTRICGSRGGDNLLFDSTGDVVSLWYKSTRYTDQISIQATAYGCSTYDIIDGDNITIDVARYTWTSGSYGATVSCKTLGFLLDSLHTRISAVCMKVSDGNYRWDTVYKYSCAAASCPPLTEPDNAVLESASRVYGSQAVYTCNKGYRLSSGSQVRSCNVQHGQGAYWTGDTVTCSIKNCGVPRIPNGDFTNLPSTAYGSNFSFTCNRGYLSTSGVAECLDTGYWSYQPCIQVTQAPLAASTTPVVSQGLVIGISTGASLLVLFLLILLLVACYRKRRMKKKERTFTFGGPVQAETTPNHGSISSRRETPIYTQIKKLSRSMELPNGHAEMTVYPELYNINEGTRTWSSRRSLPHEYLDDTDNILYTERLKSKSRQLLEEQLARQRQRSVGYNGLPSGELRRKPAPEIDQTLEENLAEIMLDIPLPDENEQPTSRRPTIGQYAYY